MQQTIALTKFVTGFCRLQKSNNIKTDPLKKAHKKTTINGFCFNSN